MIGRCHPACRARWREARRAGVTFPRIAYDRLPAAAQSEVLRRHWATWWLDTGAGWIRATGPVSGAVGLVTWQRAMAAAGRCLACQGPL